MPIVKISTWQVSEAHIADSTLWTSLAQEIGQAPGCLGVYSGIAEEDGKRFHSFVVWESLGHYDSFSNSPGFGTLLTAFEQVRSGPSQSYFVAFNQDFIPALSAPTTEILRMSILDGKSTEDLESIVGTIKGRIDSGNEKFAPVAWGPIVKNQEGEDGKQFYLVIGWESVKAHVDFVTEASFVPLIDSLKETAALEMFHSHLTRNV
ncbi:hypothetical protein JR316_0010303 [Psilocybe cubensis]|uniref:ABM domain-containing protein n=2 Tax=Psilocybe cubensis TaxID=181762 RepID=A0A8H8CGP8_PSICU|nr:hypothetical protein JR316_0010303 [Psilocybe cubensis]KAH9478066.1 hypothetical protein JR316_0010303 [Psilocybe cubensis]